MCTKNKDDFLSDLQFHIQKENNMDKLALVLSILTGDVIIYCEEEDEFSYFEYEKGSISIRELIVLMSDLSTETQDSELRIFDRDSQIFRRIKAICLGEDEPFVIEIWGLYES